MLGQLWEPLGREPPVWEPVGAGVGVVCVVLAALDVDDVAAFAIAAPPAASEPVIASVATAVAIRCRIVGSLPFMDGLRVNSPSVGES
jgi:hypothetical protein